MRSATICPGMTLGPTVENTNVLPREAASARHTSLRLAHSDLSATTT